MMLFREDDLAMLEAFLSGISHATLLVRPGGFAEKEESFLADKFLNGQNSNLLRLTADDGKKGVGVEQVRSLAGSLATTSIKGDKRLVLVSDRYFFGVQAQNAFLKILEEPPEGVFFLLLASSVESFLATIVSRTQIVKLQDASEKEATDYLINDLGFKREDAKMIYLQAGGSPAEILRLAGDDAARKRSLDKLSQAKGFLGQKSYDRLVALRDYQSPGKRDEATEFLRSLLVVLELASKKDAKEALRWADMVEKTEKALVNINLNANSKVELLDLI